MIEEQPSAQSAQSMTKLMASRLASKLKQGSKLSPYETNMENFSKNQKFTLERIDPKGVAAVSIYGSFSGVIQNIQLFSNCPQTFKLSYRVCMGPEWHDQTPQIDDTEGQSNYCQSRNGKVSVSLSFDFLLSCMYVSSWPKIVVTISSFNYKGELVPKGYAHIDLPSETGQFLKQAYIYSIIRNESWFHKWMPFLEAAPSALDQKQIQRVIVKGEGRQSQKVKCIGVLNVRVETLLRNFQRFGYK